VLEKFTYGGGYAGEDERADDCVREGGGGESDAALASDALRTWLGWLAWDLGSWCSIFNFDFYEGGHVVIRDVACIDWMRLGGVVVSGIVVVYRSSIVPIPEDVQVDIYLHLVNLLVVMIMVVYVVVMVMVVWNLGLGVFGASAGLNFL
jgi:hypothetical protein